LNRIVQVKKKEKDNDFQIKREDSKIRIKAKKSQINKVFKGIVERTRERERGGLD